MVPPLVTLEEHYYSKPVFDSFDNSMKGMIEKWPGALDKLFSVQEQRLDDMDRGKVSLQVISHCVTEGPSPDVCRAGNDQLAADIARAGGMVSKRFAGFAVLPMTQPEAAAEELERSVREHQFVGALVDHKVKSRFCDGAEYDVLWAKLQQLDVPIYLHPSWPSEEQFQLSYYGNFSTHAATLVGGAMWSWHSEVGLHVLRLHVAGVFDRFPRLKIIVGHFGEMMPFMLQRIQDQEMLLGPAGKQPQRSFKQVWDENIWITTSGCWDLTPMHCILQNTRVDHILYSVDYPFTSNEKGLAWMETLANSGLVTTDQLEMIAYKNACALLRLKLPES